MLHCNLVAPTQWKREVKSGELKQFVRSPKPMTEQSLGIRVARTKPCPAPKLGLAYGDLCPEPLYWVGRDLSERRAALGSWINVFSTSPLYFLSVLCTGNFTLVKYVKTKSCSIIMEFGKAQIKVVAPSVCLLPVALGERIRMCIWMYLAGPLTSTVAQWREWRLLPIHFLWAWPSKPVLEITFLTEEFGRSQDYTCTILLTACTSKQNQTRILDMLMSH